MQKPIFGGRDRQPNLHRNIGSDTHILRLAAAPTRYLFDLEHYFVLDNRASVMGFRRTI